MENCVINCSICLSDVPRGEIKKGANGKLYLGVIVSPRKEKDDYGNDISLKLDIPKEVREQLPVPIYIGEGTFKDFTNENAKPLPNQMIKLRVCISDIPKDKYRESEKSGKHYVNITIQKRKERDKHGNDLYAVISQTKAEREAEIPKVYVGEGMLFDFNTREKLEEMEGVDQSTRMPWEVDEPGNDDLPY